MECPDCRSSLREIYFKLEHSTLLDICDPCQGVFYDNNELKRVISTIRDAQL